MNDTERNGETLIFTCAGAAHCGQVANRCGVQLSADDGGQLFCLAAVSADIPAKMERSRQAAVRVAIDGCDDECARLTLERAGLPVEVHVVATAAGVERKPERPHLLRDSRRLAIKVHRALAVQRDGRVV